MLYKKFRKTIEKHKMLSDGCKAVVAVSGGIDSMVLLYLMDRYSREKSGELIVAHMNHMLRGDESVRDEKFVVESAKKLGRDCIVGHLPDMKRSGDEKNFHAYARKKRYEFFEELRVDSGAECIALGHNSDDQAETVIMRLIRGTGIKGLGGISPVRDRICRPLIEASREEIAAFARAKGIGFVEDSSNASTKYMRNSIRHELMPFLEKYNPNIKAELVRVSDSARDAEFSLDMEAERVFKSLLIEIKGEPSNERLISVDKRGFFVTADEMKTRMIFKALEFLNGTRLGFFSNHIATALSFAEYGKSGDSISLPSGIQMTIGYETIVFSKKRAYPTREFSASIDIGEQIFIEEAGFSLSLSNYDVEECGTSEGSDFILIDKDKVEFPLHIRNFRKGDRVRPLGMDGSKKLKDFFIDEKIPRSERMNIPLLLSKEEIIWVVGMRKCGKAHITPESRQLVKVSKI